MRLGEITWSSLHLGLESGSQFFVLIVYGWAWQVCLQVRLPATAVESVLDEGAKRALAAPWTPCTSQGLRVTLLQITNVVALSHCYTISVFRSYNFIFSTINPNSCPDFSHEGVDWDKGIFPKISETHCISHFALCGPVKGKSESSVPSQVIIILMIQDCVTATRKFSWTNQN